MPDEFDTPLEQEKAGDFGEDAEVPIIQHPPTFSAPNRLSKQISTLASKGHVRPALQWLLALAMRPLKRLSTILTNADNWTAFATLVIAVATVVYTVYAGRQWREMVAASSDTKTLASAASAQAKASQDQVALLRQQLEATEGAIITIEASSDFKGTTPYLKFSLMNEGHIAAHKVLARLEVTRRSLPKDETLSTLEPWLISVQEVPVWKDRRIDKPYPLRISSRDLELIKDTRVGYRVRGNLTYNNGFATSTQTICYYFVGPFELKNRAGRNTGSGGTPSPMPCDEFPLSLQSIVYEKRDAAQE